MSEELPGPPESVALDRLKAFDFSTYAARTFVALVGLGDGTAQDVADVADVPRTRVYDAAAELRDRGMVDIQHSTPQRFWPVSTETASRQLRREYTSRLEELTAALEAVEPLSRSEEQRGVWTVTGRDTITDRVIEFVQHATDEIVYMTVSDLLEDDVVDALAAASERGVTVRVAGTSDTVVEKLVAAVPSVEPFDSLWEWSDTPAGRLLMVDRTETLVSVLVDGDGDNPPEPLDETAIWGAGEHNSLVVVLRTMFTWRLDDDRE